jgi:TatA/E family protein of Tat protein translocase
MRFEPQDIIIIAFVAFLFFGGLSRLPETMRGMGKAIREFRLAVSGQDTESEKKDKPADTKPS